MEVNRNQKRRLLNLRPEVQSNDFIFLGMLRCAVFSKKLALNQKWNESQSKWNAFNVQPMTDCNTQYLWDAKQAHAQKIHSHFRDSRDTRQLWRGIQATANYRTTTPACDSDASLPNALNVFYAQYEAENDVVAWKNTPPPGDQVRTICITTRTRTSWPWQHSWECAQRICRESGDHILSS